MTKERDDEAAEAIQAVIEAYSDVFCANDLDDGVEIHMPILRAWVLICVHDDLNDATLGAWNVTTKKFQAAHETVGMLELAKHNALEHQWGD